MVLSELNACGFKLTDVNFIFCIVWQHFSRSSMSSLKDYCAVPFEGIIRNSVYYWRSMLVNSFFRSEEEH